jgi:hypothetical protein
VSLSVAALTDSSALAFKLGFDPLGILSPSLFLTLSSRQLWLIPSMCACSAPIHLEGLNAVHKFPWQYNNNPLQRKSNPKLCSSYGYIRAPKNCLLACFSARSIPCPYSDSAPCTIVWSAP